MAEKLYIIDGHAHIYAAYYAPMRQQLVSPGGEPTKATYIFTAMVLGLLERHQPDRLVVAMDAPGRTFRHEMYSEYKAHRPPMPEDLPPQIERINEVLEALCIPVLRLPGYEADDIMGTLAKQAQAAGLDTYICSKDKDILQLLGERISVFDVKKDEALTVEDLVRDKGVTPAQFLDSLALQGDTADNIPGVPDVGPKTALVWMQKYGSLDQLLAHVDEIKGKRGENLRAFADQLELSKRLVTIDCQIPLDMPLENFCIHEPDTERVVDLFNELGFKRLLEKLGVSGTETEKTDKGGGAFGEPASVASQEHTYCLVNTAEDLADLLPILREQSLLAIDTETTSVNPMQADLVGISLSWRAHQAVYLPVRAPLGQPCLSLDHLRTQLGPLLLDEGIHKVGQNIKYDLLILENAGLPLRGVTFDTMVASYCLDSERTSHSMDNLALELLSYRCVPISELIGKGKKQITFDMVDTQVASEYAAEDADITYRLYEVLSKQMEASPWARELFETLEMPLVLVLAAMERTGVSLNVPVLRDMSNHIAAALDEAVDTIYEYAGAPFNIDSPKQLGEVLFDKLGLTSVRKGKTGRSTDAAVLEQLKNDHPIVEQVLHYRQLNKLRNTYVDKLGTLINGRTNRLHTSFNQTVTSTGRLSSSDPNLQNIPIRTELGRRIRGAFVAGDKDNSILSADYSQVELRLLAHFSQDTALLQAFTDDQDIHRFVASQIYNVSPEAVTSEMRSHSKAINFGIIYGQGAFGLSRTTGLTMAQAQDFIEEYYARYGTIRDFMDGVIAAAGKKGFVETLLGRRRQIPYLLSSNTNHRNQAHRLAVNTVIQGSAADLIKVAMLAIHRRIEAEQLPVKLLLQVHDELVFEVPTADAETHVAWIEEAMVHAMDLHVPLKVDSHLGSSWLK